MIAPHTQHPIQQVIRPATPMYLEYLRQIRYQSFIAGCKNSYNPAQNFSISSCENILAMSWLGSQLNVYGKLWSDIGLAKGTPFHICMKYDPVSLTINRLGVLSGYVK